MSKTARDVIAAWIGEFESAEHGQPTGKSGHELIAALDAAGFVIVSRNDLKKQLDDATASDNWHKYGEGYSGLRCFIERLIAPI